MHGLCLYPGRAYLELKVRIFNRTQFSRGFEWAAIAAVPKGTLSTYGESVESDSDFFGAYNFSEQHGLLQVGDRHLLSARSFISHGDSGELTAGTSSRSAKRVSVVAPFETKAFSQLWYPVIGIGQIQQANADAAVRLTIAGSTIVGVAVTRIFPNATVLLESQGTVLARWNRDLAPDRPLLEESVLPDNLDGATINLRVLTSAGRELISFSPPVLSPTAVPKPAAAAPVVPVAPRKIETAEALFFAGVRAQYEATGSRPEEYWSEALRRDPRHFASNNALGLFQLSRSEFGKAESHFRTALATVAASHSTAFEGEPAYNLGLALRYQEEDEKASAAFQTASWSFAWRSPGLQGIAELECRRHHFGVVPKFLYEALRLNADNNSARNLATVLFRRFGRSAEAEQLIRESLLLDPLDPWACHLAGRPLPGDNQVRLDLAFDYARAGLYESAVELLTGADTQAGDGSLPIIHYTLASFYLRLGDLPSAQREYQAAAQTNPDSCFPHRLDELSVLARAIALQPEDARAQYYFGCLLYSQGLHRQALEIWESSAKLDEHFATVWRNLGVGYFNVTGENEKALDAYDRACTADPQAADLFYERNELWKRMSVPPALRLQELSDHLALAQKHDALALELASLYNTTGQPERALSLFSSGTLAHYAQHSRGLDEYIRTFIKLGRLALAAGDHDRARDLFLLPLSATLDGTSSSTSLRVIELYFWLGEAMAAAGHSDSAQTYWRKATLPFSPGVPRPLFTETTWYAALAFARLNDRQHSRRLLRELWFAGRRIAREKDSSLVPFSPVFKTDVAKQSRTYGLLLQSQARVGLGQYKLAGRVLQQLLALDPNHGRALDLAVELDELTSAASTAVRV